MNTNHQKSLAFHPLSEQVAHLGAVYLLGVRGTSRVKIGWAIDVEERIKRLQTGNHEPINLVTFVAGTRALEAGLHRVFSDRRLRGEWFDDADGEVSETLCALHARWMSGEFYR